MLDYKKVKIEFSQYKEQGDNHVAINIIDSYALLEAENLNAKVEKLSTENKKNLLNFANIAKRKKLYHLALFVYSVTDYYDNPVTIAKVAVVYRRLKLHKESKETLQQGLINFPGNSNILIEYAILEDIKGSWIKSAELWKKAKDSKPFKEVKHYHWYAKTLEKKVDIRVHNSIVSEGLSFFVNDNLLRVRLAYGYLLAAYKNRDFYTLERIIDTLINSGLEISDDFYKPLSYFQEIINMHKAEKNIFDMCLNIDFHAYDIKAAIYFYEIVIACKPTEDHYLNISFEIFVQSLSHQKISKISSEDFRVKLVYFFSIFKIGHFSSISSISKECLQVLFSFSLLAGRVDIYKVLRFFEPHDFHKYKTLSFERDGIGFYKQSLITNPIDYLCIGKISQYQKKLSETKYFDHGLATKFRAKTACIVGPADVGLDNGSDIDSFDFVFRFNYEGLEGYDKNKFGSKTNYSIYIPSSLRKIKSNNNLHILEGLDGVFISKSLSELYNLNSCCVYARIPDSKDLYNPLAYTENNALQRILLNLLMYEFKEIKVFNANLFINSSTIKAYRNYNNYLKVFYQHDPVSNFIFTKKLYENKVIEVDAALADVLSLSVDEYVDKLDEAYGRRD